MKGSSREAEHGDAPRLAEPPQGLGGWRPCPFRRAAGQVRSVKSIDVLRGADRFRENGARLGELEGRSHGLGEEEDVIEYDDGVEREAAVGLEGDLDGEIGVEHILEGMLLPESPVLGKGNGSPGA